MYVFGVPCIHFSADCWWPGVSGSILPSKLLRLCGQVGYLFAWQKRGRSSSTHDYGTTRSCPVREAPFTALVPMSMCASHDCGGPDGPCDSSMLATYSGLILLFIYDNHVLEHIHAIVARPPASPWPPTFSAWCGCLPPSLHVPPPSTLRRSMF